MADSVSSEAGYRGKRDSAVPNRISFLGFRQYSGRAASPPKDRLADYNSSVAPVYFEVNR
jgi:hypothetical protein